MKRAAQGRRLAPGYRALALLHRGGDLDVYDAWSEERGCRCVAKVPRPRLATDRKVLGHLFLEGRLLLRLSHPHLVRAYELVRSPPVLVLETLTGETLARLISRHPLGFGSGDVALLGRQLASALRYLHLAGYVHLDLKPSNVIVQGGVAKLIDLSIARRPGCGHRGAGTDQYLSPEQARGDHAGPAADVWGLGAVLFECATGRPAFDPPRRGRHQQLVRPALSLRSIFRLSRSLAAAIDPCLASEARDRPTLDEVIASLERVA